MASAAILLDSYGGEINWAAADATVFVHRNDLFAMQYLAYLDEPSHTRGAQAWTESARGSMRRLRVGDGLPG